MTTSGFIGPSVASRTDKSALAPDRRNRGRCERNYDIPVGGRHPDLSASRFESGDNLRRGMPVCVFANGDDGKVTYGRSKPFEVRRPRPVVRDEKHIGPQRGKLPLSKRANITRQQVQHGARHSRGPTDYRPL